MDFLQKLDYLKNLFGESNKTLSERSGVPYTTIDGLYKRGYAGVRLSTLLKLSEHFAVSIDYLVKDEKPLADFSSDYGAMFSAETFQMLHALDCLDEFGRKAVHAVLKAETARMDAQATDPLNGFIVLPHFESPAAAGEPLWADGNYTYLRYQWDARTEKADYTVKLSGESMEPDYPDGCTVFVRRVDEINDGDVVIAWLLGQGSVCKRAIVRGERVVKLESINRAYEDYSGADLVDMKVYGKVIGYSE